MRKPVFPVLESEIARAGLNTRIIAMDGRVGCSYNTLRSKMNGLYPFTRDEMYAIKEAIGSRKTLDELFIKEAS